MPKRGLRRALTPAQADTTMTVTITTPTTTDLDAVPKVDVAHSLTTAGGMSMAVEATTSMGAYAGSMNAAKRVPMATPKAAARTPKTA